MSTRNTFLSGLSVLPVMASLLLCVAGVYMQPVQAEESPWRSDWQEVSADEGFEARCRKHQSGIKQCHFATEVDAAIGALLAVVHDVDQFTAWAEGVTRSERMPELEQADDIVVYTSYGFQGARDRFAVTRYSSQYWPGSKTVRVSFKTMDQPDPYPDLDLMRFGHMGGYWQFTEGANGATRIEHQSLTLPGGFVQSSLSYFYNSAYLDASFETIRQLHQRALTPSYAEATLDWQHTAPEQVPQEGASETNAP